MIKNLFRQARTWKVGKQAPSAWAAFSALDTAAFPRKPKKRKKQRSGVNHLELANYDFFQIKPK